MRFPRSERCSYGACGTLTGHQEGRGRELPLSPDLTEDGPVMSGHKGPEAAQRRLAQIQDRPFPAHSQPLTQVLMVSPVDMAPSVGEERRGQTPRDSLPAREEMKTRTVLGVFALFVH